MYEKKGRPLREISDEVGFHFADSKLISKDRLTTWTISWKRRRSNWNSLTKLSSSLRVYVRIDTCRIGVRVNETDVRFVIGDTIGDIQYSRGCIVGRTDTEYLRQVSTYDRLSISYHESDQLHHDKILVKVRGNDVHSSDRRKVFR